MKTDRLIEDSEQAVIDLARGILRDAGTRLKARTPVMDSVEARQAVTFMLQLELGNLPTEAASVALFDSPGRLIGIYRLSEGTPASCDVPLRKLAGLVIEHGAAGALLAHNHPSGTCVPSRQDERFTQKCGQWLAQIDCALIDHLVLTVDDWCSITGEWKC